MNFHQEQAIAQARANIENGLKSLVQVCHGASYNAGWWHDLQSNHNLRDEVRSGSRYGKALLAEKIALIHSETSESLEGIRKGLMDDKLPQYSSLATELVDILIRTADLWGAVVQEDIAEVTMAKLDYNANRPDHQLEARAAAGGKAF